MSAGENKIAWFERLNHSGRNPVDLVIVAGPYRRIRSAKIAAVDVSRRVRIRANCSRWLRDP
jgi:hypothetical protein